MAESDQKGGLSSKCTLEDVDVSGKRCLIRVDFNVPLDDDLKITDNRRIEAALPTIKYCIEKNAKCVILMSHLGRPKGQKKSKMSLQPVARELARLLEGKEILFLPDCQGDQVKEAVEKAPPQAVILLENLRFYVEEEGKGVDADGNKVKAEEEKVADFRKALSSLGDIYINDAFGTAHRAHSSMVGIEADKKVAGFLMTKELKYFGKVLEEPVKPVCAILGGAKISDKIKLIENMLDKVDSIIIGGGMAFSFLKHVDEEKDVKIGNSLYEAAAKELVPKLLAAAKEKNVEIVLPLDFKCGDKFDANAETKEVSLEEGIPDGWMGLDCGPKSTELFKQTIAKSNTIIWNGPPGVFEFEAFNQCTKDLLDAIVLRTKEKDVISVIGGGDTASAVKKFGKEDGVSHISTGGGASLELLEGKLLPGLGALSDK